MKAKNILTAVVILIASHAQAQTDPAITSWILNTAGTTGYAGIEVNVQQVQYSDSNVYVSATCIPGYSIGPWTGNPNVPANQNFVFDIPRYPKVNTGTPTVIGGGHTGILTNGVSIFSAADANSYNNLHIWDQNGYYFEYPSFDNCIGHPQQQGEYHHHVSPKCLYDITDSTHHSPIIGFAFDGYPIYGAYGYADTNGTGGIKRMHSSFQLRSITDRTTLPNGTTLPTNEDGPAISTQYPLGCYLEDYVFTPGYGDLDEHNGRYCKTPEYPNGTYAYFMTLDSTLSPAYPYTLGLTYKGILKAGDVDSPGYQGSGHFTITEPVTTYTGTTAIAPVNKIDVDIQMYPNPAASYVHFFIQPTATNNFTATLMDGMGKVVYMQKNIQPTISYTIDVAKLAAGTYMLQLINEQVSETQKIVITR